MKEVLEKTKIKEIMTKDVHTINVKDPFSKVPKIMKEYGVRHLPVVGELNKLVGYMTERHLFKIKSPRKLMDGEFYYDDEMLNNVILEHVMIPDPYALNPEHSLGKAIVKMAYSKIGSIPIVEDNNVLCGIITRGGIMKFIADIYSGKQSKNRLEN